MQDRLVIGLPLSSNVRVSVKGPDGFKSLRLLSSLPERRATITSPFGGSSLTIGYVEDRIVIRCNPIGFLTAQNWIGTSDVYKLTHRLLAVLSSERLVSWDSTIQQAIADDDINLHELAFACYVDLGPDRDAFTDLVKSCYGSMSQHLNPKHPISAHMYPGNGLIVRNMSTSLTMYDKYVKTYGEAPDWTHPVVDNITESLRYALRVECTVKYNWFGLRRSLRDWRDTDWNEVETKLFHEFLGPRFHLGYLLSCPNVFRDDFTETWSPADKRAFSLWQSSQLPDARTLRRLRSRHGFDAALSVNGHRNLLWSLLRPKTFTTPQDFDPRKLTTTPGHKLFAKYTPLHERLTPGADPKTLRRIDRACGL